MRRFQWLAAAWLLAAPTPPALAGVPDPEPLLSFAFDEGDGSAAANAGTLGTGSNGNLLGPAYSTDSAHAAGTSLRFDGDGDYMEIPDTFDYGDSITLEAWVKPEIIGGQQALYDDYGNPGVLLALVEEKLQWNISTGEHPGPGIGVAGGVLCEGLWQHVAGTYDGETIRAYVNGVDVGSAETSGTIADNASFATHVGAESGSPQLLEYKGRLDDLRLHPVAIAPETLGDGAPMFVCGELNDDCRITTTDALTALRIAVGLLGFDGAADVDDSGQVKAGDALEILRVAVGSSAQSNRCNGLA